MLPVLPVAEVYHYLSIGRAHQIVLLNFAEIYSDGELVEKVNLKVDRVLTVESEFGTNVVTVKDGKIAVTQATCPDHYCMQRGFCDSGRSIVCLPNRLVIEFVDGREIDGAVG